jgi:hypothetical protein
MALVGLLVLIVAARLLFDRDWLLGWLRGTLGLAFLATAGVIGLIVCDLFSYRALPEDGRLALVSFHADGLQHYGVDIEEGSKTRSTTLDGDLWQLDARLFKWKGLAALIGLEPGYRLDRLSGRYLAIEQQQLAHNIQVTLAESPGGIDTWRWLRLSRHDLGLFDPQALRVTFLPMADNATYALDLKPTGLLVQPLSPEAHQAMKDW